MKHVAKMEKINSFILMQNKLSWSARTIFVISVVILVFESNAIVIVILVFDTYAFFYSNFSPNYVILVMILLSVTLLQCHLCKYKVSK